MIAAGGVLGAVAVLESTTASLGPAAPGPLPVTLDLDSARTATQSDVNSFGLWVSDPARSNAPTLDERMTAAVGANAVAEAWGATSPAGAGQTPPPSTETAVRGQFDLGADSALQASGAVVGAQNSTPATALDADAFLLSGPVVALLDGVNRTDTSRVQLATSAFSTRAYGVLDTPLSSARNYSSLEPTDALGAKASARDVPASVANWSQAALEQVSARFDSGTLENDTLNISLASQAMRDGRPAVSDALNAQLRYRQAANGSIGALRETSEAARALAQGSSADRTAAVRALNWLDARGPLAPEFAVYRLRAHAFDGALIPPTAACAACTGAPTPSFADGTPAPGAPATSSAVVGKGALALWLLVGGIGLSLSLVTVDALRGSRQRLYDTVRASPGLHVNELRRRLHMSPSSIEYHLSVLTGAGLIVAEDDGRYKRYYANGAGLGLNPRSPHSRNTLGALRRPHAVTLVRALCERSEGATARELSRTLSLHESACARRLAHLEDAGVLVSERRGRARLYSVRDSVSALKALAAVEEAPPVVATTPAPAAVVPPADATAPAVGAQTPV
jgi:DNA-binding transcriptional ArsR family regulator